LQTFFNLQSLKNYPEKFTNKKVSISTHNNITSRTTTVTPASKTASTSSTTASNTLTSSTKASAASTAATAIATATCLKVFFVCSRGQ
jgi:hypothetical protein